MKCSYGFAFIWTAGQLPSPELRVSWRHVVCYARARLNTFVLPATAFQFRGDQEENESPAGLLYLYARTLNLTIHIQHPPQCNPILKTASSTFSLNRKAKRFINSSAGNEEKKRRPRELKHVTGIMIYSD